MHATNMSASRRVRARRPRAMVTTVLTLTVFLAAAMTASVSASARSGRPADRAFPPPLTRSPAAMDAPSASPSGVRRLVPAVLAAVRHDPQAFTQGLAFNPRLNQFVESTGLVGHSGVRVVDPRTGAVRRIVALPRLFGEGVAVTARNGVWQLTWRDRIVVQRDPTSLREIRRVPLTKTSEGWGLCSAPDGKLLQSDGTDALTVRDPATFAARSRILVRAGTRPVTGLNALDCSHSRRVWANVYPTNRIVHIDTATGQVRADVDLTALRRRAVAADPKLAADPEAVPNGIGTIPGSTDLYLTGKRWSLMFRVRLQSTARP